MSKTVYIHYGHNEFVTPRPIKNIDWFNKPSGGLWASRKDDKHGWKEWCEVEEFRLDTFDQFFEFTLKDDARILELNDKTQFDELPVLMTYNKISDYMTYYLDFEEIVKYYDAIEITDISGLYWTLYGWDCNCILVLNPDVIELI